MKKFLRLSVTFILFCLFTLVLTACSSGPSKKDYKESVEAFNKVITTYNDGEKKIGEISSATGSEELKKVGQEIKNWRASLDKDFKALGKKKAVKEDKTAQEKYSAAQKLWKELEPGLISMEEMYSAVLPAADLSAMSKQTTADGILKVVTDATTKLKNVKVTAPDFQEKIKKFTAILESFGTAIKENNQEKMKSIAGNLEKDVKPLSDYGISVTKNQEDKFLEKMNKDLGEYLETKANK